MGEWCVHYYDAETGEQYKGWKHFGSSRSKKFRLEKSAGKNSEARILPMKDNDGILLIGYFCQGRNIMRVYYTEVLTELRKKNV